MNPTQGTKFKKKDVGRLLTVLRQRYRNNKLEKHIYKKFDELGVRFEPTRQQGAWLYYD